jgi:hypothetical protein
VIKLNQILNELIEEKEDRCLRIARSKYDKPSMYRSGAIVRCRKGDIWKGIKEGEYFTNEIRQGLLNYLIQQLPNTPEYVIKDMIYRSLKTAHNAGDVDQGYIDQFKNIKWEKKTDFPITMDIFNDRTKKELESRIGGHIRKDIPNDEERLQLQRDKLKSQGISKEPIILFKTKDGKYELAEGKHRTIEAFKIYPEGFIQPNVYIGLNAEWVNEAKKETPHVWFSRKGGPGSSSGWVDCNTCRDGKCKSCGRQKGEKRAKYPSCRPTPAACKDPGKGKKWGKTK